MAILIWLVTMLATYALGYVRGEREAKAVIRWDDIYGAFQGVNLSRKVFYCNGNRVETQDGVFEWVRYTEVKKVIASLNVLQERRNS